MRKLQQRGTIPATPTTPNAFKKGEKIFWGFTNRISRQLQRLLALFTIAYRVLVLKLWSLLAAGMSWAIPSKMSYRFSRLRYPITYWNINRKRLRVP